MKSIIHLIVAARPNFMKVAPLYHALRKETWCIPMLVHTGQHYDTEMSDVFIRDLGLPSPDLYFGVGSGTHSEQTAGVMLAYERICLEQPPDWVVVVGDVNSTMACAITAKKLCLPVVHLEAGLRSRDTTMPEEINRVITDAISDLLWTPSPDADENLRREGISDQRIVRVGNIMIDSYEILREKIETGQTRERYGLEGIDYGVVTLHRPVNVDNRETLNQIVQKLLIISKQTKLIFPLHPRTRNRLKEFDLLETLAHASNTMLVDPLAYIEFMNLVIKSRFVVTDSGGIQEETSYLGIPCLTLRKTTERPITISLGTNRLVKVDNIIEEFTKIISEQRRTTVHIPLWDGKTAQRCCESLREHINR